jgi:hypothetical protein
LRRYAICLACNLLAAAPALAQAPVPASAGALPPYEIITMLRSTSFEPLGRPLRQGPHYLVRAIDPYGDEVRLTVDARNGRIRAVALVEDARYAPPPPYYGRRVMGPPPYFGGPPRIVTVPPDFYDDDPRLAPRAPAPAARTAARTPIPRARPADAPAAVSETAPVPAEPAVQAAPAPAETTASVPAATPGNTTPPPVGFE